MAQVVAQVWRKLVWRRFGASWLGGAGLAQVGLAQVWRKLLLSKSRNLRQTCATKPTCAKPAPNQLAPNLRHHLRHHLRHRPLTPPLAPNQGGASTKLFTPKLCTNMFPPPPTCATTCAKPHLRQTRVAHPQRWFAQKLRTNTFFFRATKFCHLTPTCATTTPLAHNRGQKARRGPKDIQLNPVLRGGIDREGGQTLFMGGASI